MLYTRVRKVLRLFKKNNVTFKLDKIITNLAINIVVLVTWSCLILHARKISKLIYWVF